MFLFTPRARTEGGLAKQASPGFTPKTSRRETSSESKVSLGWVPGLWVYQGPLKQTQG